MKRYAYIAAIGALCVGNAVAQTPLPPQKPIVIATEIGEIATQSDKVQVLVAATVTQKQTSCKIQIRDKSMMGGQFDLDPKDIALVAKLLQEASDKVVAGHTFSGHAGKASVTVADEQGQSIVILRFEADGITFSSHEFNLDADNASSLARILSRGKSVSDWLGARLDALQPKPQP